MAIQKPGIPKGTRDFGPIEMSRRNYIFQVIKNVFTLHGYAQIETPSMENLDTLLGKYGKEGDKLLFKILNSGDFLDGIDKNEWLTRNAASASLAVCKKGLRYDLTVPFARFVVQNQHELIFPFKRYQIQPVWRADNPQKGRYREFYQCDADIIGSNSLLNEADLIKIIDEVFRALKIQVKIKLNNRKILSGIADYIGHPDKITDITVAMDKMEKIGIDNVIHELKQKGIDDFAIKELQSVLFIIEEKNLYKLKQLNSILADSAIAKKGIEELSQIFDYCNVLGIDNHIEFDLTLARGLNYYTGAIIEVKAMDAKIGSICGGGRYDDLTGVFGLRDISGVGISFGADRIYDVMEQLKLFPAETSESSKILFVNFGDREAVHCMSLVNSIREKGIAAELYPEAAKINKQMSYADSRHIQYVVLAGENEIKEGLLTVKNMFTGEQFKATMEELVRMISK